MANNLDELQEKLKNTLEKGSVLLKNLSHFHEIKGVIKLEKKIKQEIKFLGQFDNKNAMNRTKVLKEEHLKCSNLYNLEAIILALEESVNPVSILQVFDFEPLPSDDEIKETPLRTRKVTVDIVSEKGAVWNKVIARNPKALDLNAAGEQQYGQRSVLQQVEDFIVCANQNFYLFSPPKINVIFHQGVSSAVAQSIERRGAKVVGRIFNFEPNSDDSEDSEFSEHLTEKTPCLLNSGWISSNQSILNLDITAMIAYVSALTNGHANYVFKADILTQQAERERLYPVKPELDSIFRNKQLICCQSALTDFKSIVATLGGEGEKKRAQDLLENKLHAVVADRISERISKLKLSGQIKNRSISIFGTGDAMQIVTVTANVGFVRAAQGQGVTLAVVHHESRALTESKMKRH